MKTEEARVVRNSRSAGRKQSGGEHSGWLGVRQGRSPQLRAFLQWQLV